MYVTLSEVKNMYNICLPDNRVNKSLLLAHDYFKRMVSVPIKNDISTKEADNFSLVLPTRKYLFDSDYDWVNSPVDVEVYQYNTETFEDENISEYITEVKNFRHGNNNRLIIKFSQVVPTDITVYPRLSFKYHLTPLDMTDKKYEWFIKDYIAMYCLYNVLNTSDVSKLQTGIANWNLSGVSLTVDSSNLRSVMEDIKNKLDMMYNEFMPFISGYMQGDVDTPARYFGYNTGIGGNSYTAMVERIRGRR